jgi:hypothetical protein
MKDSTKISIIFFITLIMGMLSTFLLLLWANMFKTECEKVDETKENCLLWNGTKCVYKCNKTILLIFGVTFLIIFIGLLFYLRYITMPIKKFSKGQILSNISSFINKITNTNSKKEMNDD